MILRRPDLEKLGAELNLALGLFPPIDIASKRSLLMKQLKNAIGLIAVNDRLTEKSWKTVNFIRELMNRKIPVEVQKQLAERREKQKSNPGVLAYIRQLIYDAGPNGITKDEILQFCVKKFPERPADGIAKTINTTVPYKLRYAGINIRKNHDRYSWIKTFEL